MAEGNTRNREKKIEELPDGWEERYDTIHGRVFYVHSGRRIAQLQNPRLQGTDTYQFQSGVHSKVLISNNSQRQTIFKYSVTCNITSIFKEYHSDKMHYGKDWINIIDNDAPLEDFPWFYGNISGNSAEKLLRQQSDGTFLIRPSGRYPGYFTISIRYANARNGILHDRILKKEHRFILNTRAYDDVFFDSLPKLVEHYTKEPPFIYGKLTAPLDKSIIEKPTDEDTTIPEEIENDPYTREIYEKAIEEGTENDSAIRVMIIGCYGQGKTSLVRRLLKQPIEGVETTNGVEVQRCVMVNDMEWEKLTEEDPEKESIQRLVKIAKSDTDYATHSTSSLEGDKYESRNSIDSSEKIDDEGSESSLEEETLPLQIMGLFVEEKTNANLKKWKKMSAQQSSKLKVDSQNLKKFQDEFKRHEKSDRNVTFNIWDFGGQFVYYSTHQIFHSKQAVYVLVFNLNVELDAMVKDDEFPLYTKTMKDYLKFWVDSVNTFVGSADGYEPPIILVGTHTDKLQEHVDVDDYFEEIRKLFGGNICLNHIQPDQFAVSNKDLSEKDITQLRNCIYALGTKQLQKNVPAKWILLEKALKLEKAKKIISFEEIIAIDKKSERPLQTDDTEKTINHIKLFLTYHHARGTFCYFDDDRLSQYVVLDPQFLIDAFGCIITSEKFCKVRPRMRKQWEELASTAILRAELLEDVWTQSDNQEFIKFKDLLTEFLKKHRIISDVLTYNVWTESFEPQAYYIVPSFLKNSADGAIVEAFCTGKQMSRVALGYVFENETILPTLYQRCLAALVGRWPILKFRGQYVVYDDVIACEIRHNHVGMLMLSKNRLELLVVNLCPPDTVCAKLCDMFRRYVEMSINTDICKLRGLNEEKRLIKNTTIRCFHADHGGKGSKDVYILEESRSNAEGKYPCPDKGNHSLRLQNILHEWFMHEIEFEKVPSRKLSSKEYSLLSMAIGRGWQQIGLQLGLDNVALEHIEMNKQTVAMQIYSMFRLWDKKEADGATLDVLVRTIYKCSEQVVSVNWDVLKNFINGF